MTVYDVSKTNCQICGGTIHYSGAKCTCTKEMKMAYEKGRRDILNILENECGRKREMTYVDEKATKAHYAEYHGEIKGWNLKTDEVLEIIASKR